MGGGAFEDTFEGAVTLNAFEGGAATLEFGPSVLDSCCWVLGALRRFETGCSPVTEVVPMLDSPAGATVSGGSVEETAEADGNGPSGMARLGEVDFDPF